MREKFYVDLPRHFIFNALNGAIALCRSDPDKAAKLIIALAQCLDYSSLTQQRVLLDEEQEFAESYMYVQSIRFAPRLRYSNESPKWPKCYIQKYAFFNVIEKALKDALIEYPDIIDMEWGLEDNDGLQLWLSFNGIRTVRVKINIFEEE